MGNPRPTKSKPCKIGRKHTSAPGIRQAEKKRRGKISMRKKRDVAFARKKELVSAYWRGEINEWPKV
jgi:hypothetical protein